MSWYLAVLKKYAVFSGRARRKEYWMFVLFSTLFSILCLVADIAIGTFSQDIGVGMLNGLYSLAVLLPSIGVTIRRLHDTGRSGWWILILLIPCVGPIVLLVFQLMEGNPDTNEYGPSPKASGA
ncbi:MAG: DUF805 domain-containing protein [Verrucomicrobiales bacterium]|nr:DUF805 domain-containing protein [Verrucomicrobiales bacterium]